MSTRHHCAAVHWTSCAINPIEFPRVGGGELSKRRTRADVVISKKPTDRVTAGPLDTAEFESARIWMWHFGNSKHCQLLQFSSPQYLYLRNVIATQPLRSTRSSSVVTFLHPPVQSRLKVTPFSSMCSTSVVEWTSLFSPHSISAGSNTYSYMSSSPDPRSAVNVSHGVFHSRLKTHLFSKSFPP